MVCLHTGSGSWAPILSDDPPFEMFPTLFPINAYLAAPTGSGRALAPASRTCTSPWPKAASGG